jgi:tryptophan synthase alpha chain
MGRIEDRFAALARRGEAALIPFLTAGDPDLETTLTLVRAAEAGGADLLELGVPFSDPMADGPTLQRAYGRALRGGTSLPRVLELVAEIRKHSEIPVVLFGYYNPFLCYGVDRFARDASAAGVDGLLCVDLPPEEAGELKAATDPAGLDLVLLLAPTSGPDRIRRVTAVSKGFVYVVSVTGVTGARTSLPAAVPAMVARVKARTRLPVAVGFGIGAPEQAAWVSSFADAAVVGSALADLIERHRDVHTLPARVQEFVATLKRAMGPKAAAPMSCAQDHGKAVHARE